jgi:BlaI family transcriptional regulator, penicillinase repressor
VLGVLWELGPATVRQVQAHLGGEAGYTTILKLMQIMTEKGILNRTAHGRLHVYRPAQSQAKTQNHLLLELINKAFGGSVQKLIVAALNSKKASEADLTEIRRLLHEAEVGGK